MIGPWSWCLVVASMGFGSLGGVAQPDLKDLVDRSLADGARSIADIADVLVEAGIARDVDEGWDQVEGLLERDSDYWSFGPEGDERVVLVKAVVDTGLTLTHRISDQELDDGGAEMEPDLDVFVADAVRDLALADGSGRVRDHLDSPGRSLLMGPAGWLHEFEPGDLVAFRRVDGTIEATKVDEADLAEDHAEVAALRAALELWLPPGAGTYSVPVVMEALCTDPSLFRSPVRPLGELLAAIGLERRGHEWGPADEDWSTFAERTRAVDLDDGRVTVGDRYDFEPCCERAFDRVLSALDRFEDGPPTSDVELDAVARVLGDDLGHDDVTAAVVVSERERLETVAAFGDVLAQATTGRRRAPALTLQGVALLEMDRPLDAYRTLVDAVEADDGYEPAAGTLALLELDRGDLAAVKRLARLDSVAADLLAWAEEEVNRRNATRASVGRNDPCPCGSGRKFKQCCARRTDVSLTERRAMVLERLDRFVRDPARFDAVISVMMAAAAGHPDPMETLRQLADGPVVVDVALFEGGLADRYLIQRGELLAEDERDLVEAIVGTPRELWEVTAVDAGRSLGLRNTRTGDEVEVPERRGTVGRSVGDLVLVRVVPFEDTYALLGVAIAVPLAARAEVMALVDRGDNLDVDALARWYGTTLRPPSLVTGEGTAVAFCRTVVDPDLEVEDVEVTLDELYERGEEDGEPVWTAYADLDLVGEPGTIEGMAGGVGRSIVATLWMAGPLVEIETMSELRMEVVVDELVDVFGEDLTIVEEHVVDPFAAMADRRAELTDRGERDADDDPRGPGAADPEMLAAAEAFIRDHERRWVDQAVPAFGGLTPRQALDDPTRREDLFAVLRDMRDNERRLGEAGSTPASGAQSAARTAELLGLDIDDL